jgi:hypothetical protein
MMLGAARRPTAEAVARRIAPHLAVVSASQPVPPLRRYNLLVLAHSPEDARRLVLSLESLETDDDKLATIALGPRRDIEPAVGADPEGIGPWLGPAIVRGALLGALAGALLIGGLSAILGVSGWQLVGAALAGAALVGVFGVIWLSFARLGGTDAFRQTFVDDSITDLTIVSVHSDDPGEIAAAKDSLGVDGTDHPFTLVEVDAHGQLAEAAR